MRSANASKTGYTCFVRRYRGRVTTDSTISAVAALEDRLRRGMYRFIRQAHRPVTRDEAAASVGISRKLAAFHLDKLVDAGLLRANYGAAGRRKVGRAPKVYEPADTDIRVSIPDRRYEMLADMFMEAMLAESPGETARQAAVRVARQRGEEFGAIEREQVKPGRLGAERALTVIETVLTRHGFEPNRESPTCVRLHNCPFHHFATQAPELVCGINHALIAGMLTGLDATTVEAALVPRPRECCVELRANT